MSSIADILPSTTEGMAKRRRAGNDASPGTAHALHGPAYHCRRENRERHVNGMAMRLRLLLGAGLIAGIPVLLFACAPRALTRLAAAAFAGCRYEIAIDDAS